MLPITHWQGTEGWTEAQLQRLVTRDCMIGTQLPLKAELDSCFGK
jgi:hypothetical protein